MAARRQRHLSRVEDRVSLVRCTKNGLICWIDEHGRLREISRDETGSIYGRGFKTITLPLLAADTERPPIIYPQFDKSIGQTCVSFTTLAVLQTCPRRK